MSLAWTHTSVKTVRIQSYSGPYFPAVRLNIRTRLKIRIRATPNTATFYVVTCIESRTK